MTLKTKRYLISSVITFLATFTGLFMPGLVDMPLTKSAILASALVALRAAYKAVIEYLVTKMSSQEVEEEINDLLVK